MPPESSRATRQARYSASTARAAAGLPPARAATSSSGTVSAFSSGSAKVSRNCASICRSSRARERRQIDPQRLAQPDQQ